MWYFISNRKNATGYDLIESSSIYKQDTVAIEQVLQTKKVPLIITPATWQGSFLAKYISQHYRLSTETVDQAIWTRK